MSKEIDIRKKRYIQYCEEHIPMHKFFGVKIIEFKEGYIKVRIPFREEVLGHVSVRYWYGGVLAMLFDGVGGMVAGSYSTSKEDKIVTLDMRIDYLKPAKEGAIYMIGEVLRAGNRSTVTNVQAYQEANDELLAVARAIYSIKREF